MKKYDVKWLDTAKEDLKNVARYVYQYSPSLAKKLTQEIRKNADGLKERPRKYPEFERIPILRKMVVQKAVVLYFIHEDIGRVEIYHIACGGQDVDKVLGK